MKKYLDKKQPEQKAQSPCLAIHDSARSSQESIEHIQVGSFYEIDHSKLPPKTPEQLQSIRVVMVSRKSLSNVSVRFPSPHSLHTHLNENSYENLDRCFLPALEELYVMGPAIASEVLYRRIPHQEIEEQSKTGVSGK
ncbi:hypothetical protein M0R45_036761 [Rubus argutus]|uniref:Uncharacterized protein n=1 Tax=Rubus argutus TaxID=59490 RepID=A0AAW1VZS4_RUBAR